LNRRDLIIGASAAIAAGELAACSAVDETHTAGISPQPMPKSSIQRTSGLSSAASRSGRYFGTAVQAAGLNDSGLRAALNRDCSSITPEWAMKWDALAPSAGSYRFDEMDRVADFAGRHGLALRGHTLLWHKSVPTWAAGLIARTREWQHVETHFQRVMTRYASRVREWDVINEPIEPNDNRSGLRNNQFLKAFGPDYIEWAFWSAHKFAPQARKMVNEYGLEYRSDYEGQRRLTLLRLLERLKKKGVPIDGVGLQAHLDLRKGALDHNGIYGMVRDITAMGLKVVVTELDVVEADTGLPLQQRDSLVADETRRYLDIVLQFPNVIGINTWGMNDGHSWLRAQRGRENRGLPYDSNWRAKAMRNSIHAALA
tara:strand:+ start:13716 stop:14828 length:1113 start_codon:yes stop_codon:yes gene_type:complete